MGIIIDIILFLSEATCYGIIVKKNMYHPMFSCIFFSKESTTWITTNGRCNALLSSIAEM